MDQQDAIDFVIEGLSQRRSVDEIVQMLCDQTGWPRQNVQRFVHKIEAARAQMPAQEVETRPEPEAVVVPPMPHSRSRRVDLGQHGAATEFVIRELGKHRDRDQIVRALCTRDKWNWKDADRFVRQVEIEQHKRIAARQSPLLILLGVSIMVGGVLMAGAAIFETLNGTIMFLPAVPVPYSGNVTYIGTGLAMLLGGIAGIWRTISMVRE